MPTSIGIFCNRNCLMQVKLKIYADADLESHANKYSKQRFGRTEMCQKTSALFVDRPAYHQSAGDNH